MSKIVLPVPFTLSLFLFLFFSSSSADTTVTHQESSSKSESSSSSRSFSKVYAFGGSSTDTGNAYSMGSVKEDVVSSSSKHVKESHSESSSSSSSSSSSASKKTNSTSYSEGRMSNGHLVVDYLCKSLDLPPLPPYQGAKNASSAAKGGASGSSNSSSLSSKSSASDSSSSSSSTNTSSSETKKGGSSSNNNSASAGGSSGGSSGKTDNAGGSASSSNAGSGSASGTRDSSSQTSDSNQSNGGSTGKTDTSTAGGAGAGSASSSNTNSGSGSGSASSSETRDSSSETAGGSSSAGGSASSSNTGSGSGSAGGSIDAAAGASGSIEGGAGVSAGGSGGVSGHISFSFGVNFAISGSTFLSGNSTGNQKANPLFWAGVPPQFQTEIDWFKEFLASKGCHSASDGRCKAEVENALFWLGAVGVSDYSRLDAHSVINLRGISQLCILHIAKLLRVVLEAGAKYIVVQGLPPVGCLPVAIAPCPFFLLDRMGCSMPVNTAIDIHNRLLVKTIETFRRQYPGSTIVYANYWKAFQEIFNNFEKYKFEEKSKACCGAGGGNLNFDSKSLCGSSGATACKRPDKYISWDGIHFTDAMNEKLAELFFKGDYCEPPFSELISKRKSVISSSSSG